MLVGGVKKVAGGVDGVHAVILRPMAPPEELAGEFYSVKSETGLFTKAKPLL